jgi:hypothetical protein
LKKSALLLAMLACVPTAFAISSVDLRFQNTWNAFWRKPLPATTSYQSLRAAGDTAPGFHGDHVYIDVNYHVLANNTMPEVDVLVPSGWINRSTGTVWQGRIHVPSNFVLPDATPTDSPNNPTIILNTDSGKAMFLNGTVRPKSNGPVWGYKSDTIAITHGGSGLAGGEVTLSELQQGTVNHALALDVWGKKYLSRANGGFVPPAIRADTGYNNPADGNYYNGNIPNLTMGTRLAIPPSVTARKLNVTSKQGVALFNALKTYGAYIVDNSAWNVIYLNATADAQPVLMKNEQEMARMFAALQIVK